MNFIKFRIKKITYYNTRTLYLPQWKFLFFWHYFEYETGDIANFKTLCEAEIFIEEEKRCKSNKILNEQIIEVK